jgi:hypothetical protein|tara:strand:- start:642 stop:818 length:177 start_codon:yes stop_codon:yes gene_type:complete
VVLETVHAKREEKTIVKIIIRKGEREKIERTYRGNTRWKENCTFIKNVVVYLLIFADR